MINGGQVVGARSQTGQTLLEFARDRGSQRCADFLQRSEDKASRLSANARVQKKRAQYKHGDGERADDFLRHRIKGATNQISLAVVAVFCNSEAGVQESTRRKIGLHPPL